MIQLILSLLTLGFIDCLNPATIATLIVLLPLVQKTKHASIFIWGTFVTYIGVGISIYYGLDKIMKPLITNIASKYAFEMAIVGMVIGIILVIVGLYFSIQLWKTIKNKDDAKEMNFIKINNVKPIAIVMLAIVSTLSDAPTAIPYIIFINDLLDNHLHVGTTLIFITIYCFIYITPMLALYIAYDQLKHRFETIERKTRDIINKVAAQAIPILCFVGAAWILYKSFHTLMNTTSFF